jgi:phage anti-repressor protein
MNELIPVVEYQGKQGVNARDLHMRLEVGRDFSNWIKDRIKKYGFVEGEDYIKQLNLSSPNLASSKARPQTLIDYLLYLQMAKEIAIVENNPKGREIRRYLIKLEEAWNTPEAVMARARQMGVIPNWKEPSVARIREFRIACEKGYMTVNEYRRQAFNLPSFEVDAPLAKPSKDKPQVYRSPEVPTIKSDELFKFVDEYLELTENLDDYVKANDLYNRYVKQSEDPLSRWTFVHTMKGSFSLTYKQKKINGYPTLVFMGCKFKAVPQG